MTRSIKFRAWNVLEQKMICPVAVNDRGFPYIWDDKFLHLVPMTSTYYDDGVVPPVMQFTGFLDKNGKEIYEGDVIQWKSSSPGRGSVYWNQEEGAFMHTYREPDGWVRPSKRLWCNPDVMIKIIGNIYEKQDLCRGKFK